MTVFPAGVIARGLSIGAALIMVTGIPAFAEPLTTDPGVNLPGADIRGVTLGRRDGPDVCRALCQREAACRAYTFVRAGVQGDRARCWLKRSVPPGTRDACCTSGVRMTREQNTDRPGGDLRQEPRVAHLRCEQICADDAGCRAYTWVPHGRRRGTCYLKSSIPGVRAAGGMISGTKPPIPMSAPQPQPGAIGCFVDRAERDLTTVVPGDRHTPDQCIEACRARAQAFAGVQFGGHCFCGQGHGRYGAAPRAECGMPCRGRADQTCGGAWRNLVMATGVAAPGAAAPQPSAPDPPPQQVAGGHEVAADPPARSPLQAALASMRSRGPDGTEVVGLDAILRAHEVNGAAVVLIEGGVITQSSYHGYRDRQRQHRIDAETRFDMASTTKLVAALATVRASREGRAPPLDLSLRAYLDQRSPRKLSRWARRTFRRKKDRLEGITLRRLLSHTAGLSNSGIGIDTRDRDTSARRVLRDTDSRVEPGTDYSYSGGGYTVAELMVGGWARPSARDVLEEFLRHMGMHQSTFADADRVPRLASTCSRGRCRDEAHTEVKFAGGLLATPRDYARVLLALLGEGPIPEADIVEILRAGRLRRGSRDEPNTSSLQACGAQSDCPTGEDCYGERCIEVPLDVGTDPPSPKWYGLGVRLERLSPGGGLATCVQHSGAHSGSKRGARAWFFLDRVNRRGAVIAINGASEWSVRGKKYGTQHILPLIQGALRGLAGGPFGC